MSEEYEISVLAALGYANAPEVDIREFLDKILTEQEYQESLLRSHIGVIEQLRAQLAKSQEQVRVLREALQEVEWDAKQYCEGFDVMWGNVANVLDATQPKEGK